MTIDDGMQAGAQSGQPWSTAGGDQRRARKPDAAGLASTSLQLERYQAAGDQSRAGERCRVAADGSVTLPARSVAVHIERLPQGESQGAGLPVSSKK